MKKHLLIGLLASLPFCCLTSCGKNNDIVKDGKTINVKAYKGGYGDTWLYKLKERFETIYAAEGYKVNIVKTSSAYEGASILSDMRVIGNGVDMYFVQNVFVDDTVSDDYGVCIEDISSVYESHPIKADGTEEEVLIKDKLSIESKNVVSKNGKFYGFEWANSPCGLIVNTKVLNNFSLSIPNTTDELFSCYDKIMNEGDSIRPFVWGGGDAYGYALYALYPYLAQLMGTEKYTQFMNLQTGATVVEDDYKNGHKRYEDDDIYTAINTLKKMYNTSTSINNSINMQNMKAHHNIMTDKAAFTVDGDFFYNEVKENYASNLANIKFINIPVISDLGIKLKLDGDGSNREKCDKILSLVVSKIDEGKTNEEIVEAVSSELSVVITDSNINRIREARGVNYQKLCSIGYVAKNTQNLDLCKLLLRVAASDDFGHVFNEVTNTVYPYCKTNNVDGNEFSKGVGKVINSSNSFVACNLSTGGLRKLAAVPTFPTYSSDIVRVIVTDDYEVDIKNKVLTNVNANWENWMHRAGF